MSINHNLNILFYLSKNIYMDRYVHFTILNRYRIELFLILLIPNKYFSQGSLIASLSQNATSLKVLKVWMQCF